MAFSKELKVRVRRRAAFTCCRCHEIGVEIHHIISQAEGGADSEDNAAPLCPNCHTWFGANREKRNEIRQMRDWWYEVCETKFGTKEDETARKLDELLREVRRQSASEEERQKATEEIDRTLKELVNTVGFSKSDSAAEVASKVEKVVTATRLGEGVHANVRCNRCGTVVGLLVGSNACPTCGAAI